MRMPQPAELDTNCTWRPVRGRREQAPTEVGSLVADAAQSRKVINLWEEAAKRGWTGTTVGEVWPVGRRRPLTDPAPEVVELNEPSGKDMLDAELLSYMALPHGWDGYEGVPAPLDAVTDALIFVNMRPNDIRLPYPQIGPDGEVGLYWHAERILAEVSFYGDGEYSYHARYTPAEGTPVRRGRDGCSLHAGWDTGLLLVLNKISR